MMASHNPTVHGANAVISSPVQPTALPGNTRKISPVIRSDEPPPPFSLFGVSVSALGKLPSPQSPTSPVLHMNRALAMLYYGFLRSSSLTPPEYKV